MSKHIQVRLDSLRLSMRQNGIDAVIIPGTDPHASEYIASCWKDREWISGFTGSAGTVMVGLEFAGLWTDSRYFLQATNQLEGSGIHLMKQGLAGTPEINTWLIQNLEAGKTVAVNAQMISANAFKKLKFELQEFQITLVGIDLVSSIWTDRPEIPAAKIFAHDTEFNGLEVKEKLSKLRAEIIHLNSDTLILSSLDDIAWIFNIRGKDVDYNPVAIAYAIVNLNESILFIDPAKVDGDLKTQLQSQGVYINNYAEIYNTIEQLNSKILIDGNKLNQSLFESIPKTCKIKEEMSPVFKLKSIKNSVEVQGIRTAMIRDAVALTRFFMWLEGNMNTNELTELSITSKLHEFRASGQYYYGESFGTICGFAGHGAIVHYSADEVSNSKLTTDNILLLDSGGQYLDGTTDITRTVSLGNVTEKQKLDFTLVLKGHIGIATVLFPSGTRGSQLDILARKAMWDRQINYGHGTGHGVGHFLNVHEGPQSIRSDENPTILQAGMILSNEPGLYRTNEYGIRTENLVHVIEVGENEFGKFLGFETLTLFPIDKNLIDKSTMTSDEIAWVNNYHQMVYDRVSPQLTQIEAEWLSEKCAKI